jgi:hypothetical protein
MSILSVYKPGINSTVNELFVLYEVMFVWKKCIKYVNKAMCSMLQKITLNMSVFVIICVE